MSRVLVDTSAYSALLRGHDGILAALQTADEVYVNPVVLGELRAGFLRGSRRKQNEKELAEFLASPRVSIVDMTPDTALYYAVIVQHLRAAGSPIPTNDVWIAASGAQHGLQVLTTDGHYLKVPQVMVDYFEPL